MRGSRCRPDCVPGVRGYDAEAIRQSLRTRHIIPWLARRNTEHGSGLGRWRWVVERSFTCELDCERDRRTGRTQQRRGWHPGSVSATELFLPSSTVTQSPEQGGGCRRSPKFSREPLVLAPSTDVCSLGLAFYRNLSDSSSQIRWRVSWLGSPWPLGSRRRRDRRGHALAQRLIYFSTYPEAVQQDGQLPRHRYRRSLLRILPTALAEPQPIPS